MPKTLTKQILCETALRQNYILAIKKRSENFHRYKLPAHLITTIALELIEPKFAKLFIEAQFSHFPIEWCQRKFKIPFPPANVVFGGRCIERYVNYIETGERIPV